MSIISNCCNKSTVLLPLSNINQKLTGNIIPHEWYKHITNESGRPDVNAITILSEIVYWFRPNAKGLSKFLGDAWQTSYRYLSDKYLFSKETIRRSLVKLEGLGFIKRELRIVYLRGQRYNNVLFIHLGQNISEILSKSCSSHNKAKSLADNKTLDQNVATTGDNSTFFDPKFVAPSPQIIGDYIDIKNKNNKNRSSESSFLKICKEEKKSEEILPHSQIIQQTTQTLDSHEISADGAVVSEITIAQDVAAKNEMQATEQVVTEAGGEPEFAQANIAQTQKLKPDSRCGEGGAVSHEGVGYGRKKPLSYFAAISEEEAQELRVRSNREFDTNFINALMQRLAKKYPDHSFYGRKQVLSYMSKVLSYELRQAVAVNNVNFKFKEDRDQEVVKREQYLDQVENSTDSSAKSQLSKKIAGVFDPEVAYELLTNIYTASKITKELTRESTSEITGKIRRENEEEEGVEQGIFRISLSKELELSFGQKEMLLRQVKAVYDTRTTEIKELQIDYQKPKEQESINNHIIKPVVDNKLQELPQVYRDVNKNNDRSMDQIRNQVKDQEVIRYNHKAVTTEAANGSELWSMIRDKLKDYYGSAIDKSWFSRLCSRQEEETNKLILIAPTKFIRDWIISNYSLQIFKLAKEANYEYEIIV